MSNEDIFKVVSTTDETKVIEVTRLQLSICETLKNLIEDTEEGDKVPVKQPVKILKLAMKYCIHYNGEAPEEDHYTIDGLDEWETNFIETLKNKELLDLMTCADFLQNPFLLNCCFRGLADRARGKTDEEVKEICLVSEDSVIEDE